MERHVWRAENVAGHIAERAGAEVIKTAPAERLVEIAAKAIGFGPAAHRKRPLVGNAEPQIPVKSGRHGLFLGDLRETLGPDGPIAPGVDLSHTADIAIPDNFRALASAFVGVALIAHLRGHAIFGGGLAELAGFPDGAHEGLLDVDVFASLHAPHGGGGVHMVGGGDDYGVDVFAFLVEHLAEVAIGRGFGEGFEGFGGAAVVDVAQRDDVLRGRGGADVACALPAGADGGEVKFLIGGFVSHGFE